MLRDDEFRMEAEPEKAKLEVSGVVFETVSDRDMECVLEFKAVAVCISTVHS